MSEGEEGILNDDDDDVGPGPDSIDVGALMADLRARVAEKKERGMYTVDALALDEAEAAAPFGEDDLARLRDLSVVSVDLSTSASTKPVVGPAVGQAKRALVRGTSQPLYSLAGQVTAFHGAVLGYLAALAREVAELRRRTDALAAELGAAPGGGGIGTQVAGLHEGLEGLQRRLARLEHPDPSASTATPSTAPAVGTDAVIRAVALAPDDPDESRLAGYADLLGERALQVGAGSGRALDALGEDAEGVEDIGPLVAAARREGRSVHHADPVGFTAALAPGSRTGVLVTGLVERLDGERLAALAAAMHRAVCPGGRVVVEGLDPASPAAWADVWRLRPVQPEGIGRLLEGAGFTDVRVERSGDGARYAVHATR